MKHKNSRSDIMSFLLFLCFTAPILSHRKKQRRNTIFLHSEDFFFLSCEKFINLLEIFIVEFLDIVFCILFHIFAHTLLHSLLKTVDSITACVAHTNFRSLGLGLGLLYESATAFFGQRGMEIRIISPLFSGVMPSSEFMMAFSISLNIAFSHGVMVMVRASGTATLAT